MDIASFTESDFQKLCHKLQTRAIFCCAGLIELEESWEFEESWEIEGLWRYDRTLNVIHRSVIEFL